MFVLKVDTVSEATISIERIGPQCRNLVKEVFSDFIFSCVSSRVAYDLRLDLLLLPLDFAIFRSTT